MAVQAALKNITDRIILRSETFRQAYIERMRQAAGDGPRRAHLTCGNQAHAYAAMGNDKKKIDGGIWRKYWDNKCLQRYAFGPSTLCKVSRYNKINCPNAWCHGSAGWWSTCHV